MNRPTPRPSSDAEHLELAQHQATDAVRLIDKALANRKLGVAELRDALLDVRNQLRPPAPRTRP